MFRSSLGKYSLKKKKAQFVFAMCHYSIRTKNIFPVVMSWPGQLFVFLRGSGSSGFAVYHPQRIQSLQAPALTMHLLVS